MRRQESYYFNIMCSTRILLSMFLRLFSELLMQLLLKMALFAYNIHVQSGNCCEDKKYGTNRSKKK